MGNFFGGGGFAGVLDPLDLMGQQKKKGALSTIGNAAIESQNAITSAYDTAKPALTEGYNKAIDTARTGFQTARGDTSAGYGKAGQQLATGGQEAINTARQGYKEAQGRFETPEMVASRAELYKRIMGQGGLSPEVLNQQEAAAREEYGTGMRGAAEAANAFQGESAAPGLAQENIARAAAELGAKRANAIRDIGVGNAQLARQEQTGAIATAENEALQRAGLSAQEAQTVSGLQEKVAEGGANLTAQETNALAQLAAQEGTTVADLQAKLASGTAALSTDEAKALAEIISGAGANKATVQSAKTGLFGLW